MKEKKYWDKSLLLGIIFLLNTTIAFDSFAKKELHPILVEYELCKTKADGTHDNFSCAYKAYKAWDQELNKVYKELMSSDYNASVKEKLKNSEKAWIALRNEEFELLGEIFDEREGTIWPTVKISMQANIIKRRVEDLYNILYAANMAESLPYTFNTTSE